MVILGVIYDFNNDHMYIGDKQNNYSTNDKKIHVSNKNNEMKMF